LSFPQVLAGHRILSAPVVATESNDVEHKETAEPHDSIKDVAGFIDIRDVLSSFLQGMFIFIFPFKAAIIFDKSKPLPFQKLSNRN
jgi:hypothetical protein